MSSLASYEKGMAALRLYRRIMKLHIRNMPNDLRLFGDLYVKQEFRLHLDKASEEQMDKFMVSWEGYAKQIEGVDMRKGKEHIREKLNNPEYDYVVKEKFNPEQQATLGDFKNLIFESERRKQQPGGGGGSTPRRPGGCG